VLIEALSRTATLVPVTTRTIEQLRRVRLTGSRPAYAVAANGGRILVDGRPDPSWTATVTARLSSACISLPEMWQRLDRLGDPAWMPRRHQADDLFCYAIVDRATLPPTLIAELAEWCSTRGWLVSVQGRKLYCVPRPLTKWAAVAELRRRLDLDLVIAAGDSSLDRELLAAADAGIRPAHGELHEQGWHRERVAVTDAAGIRAGEEIAACLLGWTLTAAEISSAAEATF
jgi:hypothetical protein